MAEAGGATGVGPLPARADKFPHGRDPWGSANGTELSRRQDYCRHRGSGNKMPWHASGSMETAKPAPGSHGRRRAMSQARTNERNIVESMAGVL
jgi:hypothetical protein